MKSIKRIVAVIAVAMSVIFPSAQVSAQSAFGDMLGNMLQGVFSKSNLSVYDICGQWTSNGAAVTFQSDNFLQKAGGLAAAGVIENKINPYFNKLGLNGAVLTIEADSTFTLKAKKFTLNGTIRSNGDGTFDFTFKALKAISLGTIKTYVQKSGNSMDVMFDAKKLKNLISGIAKISGISMAKTAATLLDSYDGLCVGFKTTKTGDVVVPESARSQSGSGLSSVLGNIFGGGLGSGSSESQSSTPATEEKVTTPTEESAPQPTTPKKTGGFGGVLKEVLK